MEYKQSQTVSNTSAAENVLRKLFLGVLICTSFMLNLKISFAQSWEKVLDSTDSKQIIRHNGMLFSCNWSGILS
jgi:hypothetical protein